MTIANKTPYSGGITLKLISIIAKITNFSCLFIFLPIQVYLIITLSLGSIEIDRVISETVL